MEADIPPEFLHHYNTHRDGLYADQWAPRAYDAVWTIAVALNDTLTEMMYRGRTLWYVNDIKSCLLFRF